MLHPTILTTLSHFSVVLPYSPLHQCNIQCLIRSEDKQKKIGVENTVMKKAKRKAKESMEPASLLQSLGLRVAGHSGAFVLNPNCLLCPLPLQHECIFRPEETAFITGLLNSAKSIISCVLENQSFWYPTQLKSRARFKPAEPSLSVVCQL